MTAHTSEPGELLAVLNRKLSLLMIFQEHSRVEVLALSVSLKLLPARSQFVSVQLPLSQLLCLCVIPEPPAPSQLPSLFLCCRWRQL